jgi:cytochrome bd-type quinol oxidase subunit 1
VTAVAVLGHSQRDTVIVYTRPKMADMEKALERTEA